MKQNVVTMKQVKVHRGAKRVLDIASLNIAKGELVAVLGPNGSGKSTLLQVLNGLLAVSEGTAQVLGVDLPAADTLQLRRRSAMVFQDPLFIHDTVYANVAMPLQFRGLPEKTVREQVEAALVSFRCSHLATRLAHRLSGGEAQRVCLARAFVTGPELVLLDEPFSALDPATRNDLLSELKSAAVARQANVILVSHNLDEVLRFAQRTLVLDEGRIVQDALPGTVLRRPANSVIARLAGMDNIWPCRVSLDMGQATVHVNERIIFAAPGAGAAGNAWCCLPGDSFRIFGPDETPGESWFPVEGVVDQVSPGIGISRVHMMAGNLAVTLCVAVDRAAGLSKGEALRVAFRIPDAHIIMQ